jgi:hypothetical protein
MHGVLFFVLKEMIAFKDPLAKKFDLHSYLAHCEQNFVAAIETYEVLAVPSFENILALVMGVSPTSWPQFCIHERTNARTDDQIPRRSKTILVLEARFGGCHTLPIPRISS